MAELLKADGQETNEQEIQQIWTELTKRRQEDEQKLSLDELDEVSGGRDYAKKGCCATVEPGSWCGSNDACIIFDVCYANAPVNKKCPNCRTYLYNTSCQEGLYKVYKYVCWKCGYEDVYSKKLLDII